MSVLVLSRVGGIDLAGWRQPALQDESRGRDTGQDVDLVGPRHWRLGPMPQQPAHIGGDRNAAETMATIEGGVLALDAKGDIHGRGAAVYQIGIAQRCL